MSAQEPAPIVIDCVSKQFAGAAQPALDEISGEIRAGVITGLVGPDGAGKTTLIRLLAGLMTPTAGSIQVLGLDPIRNADELREKVGYMPQKFGLYEDLSVQENLDLYADLRGVLGETRRETLGRLLEFTDLARFTRRLAGKLSGGMKQKLGLACTLIGQPRVLLLDEPGVGVDPISRGELWKMVGTLAGEGLAIIWSTAYMDEAERCEDVLLLNEGKMLYRGAPRGLSAQLSGRCWQVRGIEGNRRELLAAALRKEVVVDGVIQGRSVRLVLRKDAPPLSPEALGAGAGATMAPVEPRFEDAFIDLLGGVPHEESVLAAHLPQAVGNGETVIEARDLTKKFGDFAATDRVTFSVERGEIFGLLGPNGAGKSTTFKMMCGLLKPTSGTAKVAGIDLKKSASEARQRLGYMAQKFSLYGNLSVQQNLMFFSGAYGLHGTRQRKTVETMVRVFNLEPHLHASAETLPPGFKQRLALACAVMHEPAILFLDEPTSGVDPLTRREFWTHINGVVERGVTVMVTTHFMDEAEYCDRIGLVYRGRLIAVGTPDELKEMAATTERPDPTMEEAFIALILNNQEEGNGAA